MGPASTSSDPRFVPGSAGAEAMVGAAGAIMACTRRPITPAFAMTAATIAATGAITLEAIATGMIATDMTATGMITTDMITSGTIATDMITTEAAIAAAEAATMAAAAIMGEAATIGEVGESVTISKT